MPAAPIAPVDAAALMDRTSLVQTQALPIPQSVASPSFAQLLTNGIDGLNTKLQNADTMVRAFTLDDSIPVHQVTFALEQAKDSMELALQVRTRLLEGYQQLMNMQL